MHYRVLFPVSPYDPRHATHPSRDAMIESIGGDTGQLYDEAAAVAAVRERYPDAVGMPVPLRVGSGDMTVLGILESIRSPHPQSAEEATFKTIPFVAIVLAIPETTADKKPGRQFRRELWRVPVREPTFAFVTHRDVEVRSTELDNPLIMDVSEGAAPNGQRVIHGSMPGGLQLSITFPPPARVDDLRFQVVQDEHGFYGRCDAFPYAVSHGDSEILALSTAIDEAKRNLTLAPAPSVHGDGEFFKVRGRQERWAIDKRIAGDGGEQGDGFRVERSTGELVMMWRDVVADAERHLARDYIPWHEPPNWPGVVAVIHPAAWSSTGTVIVEGLLRRFGKDVHIVWHGSKWYLLFVGEPHQGNDLYSEHDCQWWAVAHPDGRWESLAAS